MKAFYCAYPINDHIKRSFAGAAYSKEWLSALKELSKPKSACVPRFLFTILKSVISDQSDDRLHKVTETLFYLDDANALKMFKEQGDAISWDILTRFIEWKREMLPDIIKRGRLYWDVLKSSKLTNSKIVYPPIVHGFIELSTTETIHLATQLALLPLPAHNKELFFMLIFKFYYNHRIEISKHDGYDFTYERRDENYSFYKKITSKMFQFIELIEETGFELVGRGVRVNKSLIYNAKRLFEKFLQWADITENVKSYLFLPIVKYYIFLHFVTYENYLSQMYLRINLQ
jgi:hypothetical protein